MIEIDKIKWHDSPLKSMNFDFEDGDFKIGFIEFGTEIHYDLLLKEVIINKSILEKSLDLYDSEISSVRKLENSQDKTILEIGIYSPMNGFLKIEIECKKAVIRSSSSTTDE